MGEGTKGCGEKGMKQPVIIMIQCLKCSSNIAFMSSQWEMGKCFTILCSVCKKEYRVAFTIELALEATETPMPDYIARGFENNHD